MLINERFVVPSELLEKVSEGLPSGVLLRVSYPVCNIGLRNENNRIYEAALWDRVLCDAGLQEKLVNRTLFGHAEHPETTQSNVEKVSHVVTKFWKDATENKMKQTFEVLDTPYGRIVATLLNAGCGLGCSTRAEGELEESEDSKGKFNRVIPEKYTYITTDFTADPSTIGVYPENVESAMVDVVRNGLETKKMDPQYARLLLENVKSDEAKALLETLPPELARLAHPGTAGLAEAEYTCPKCKQTAMHEDTGEKINCDCGSFMKKTEASEGTQPLTFESFDAAVAYFEEAFAKIADEEQKETMHNLLHEAKLVEAKPSQLSKTLRMLRVQLAESKAELDVLKEVDEAREKALTEASGIKDEIAELEKQIKELEATLADTQSMQGEAMESFGRKLMASLKEKVKTQRVDEAKSRQEVEGKYRKESTEEITGLKEQIEELKKLHERELVKKYVQVVVEKTGLKLGKQFRALLENASDEAAVESLLDQIRDEVSEGLQHSGAPREVTLAAGEPDAVEESVTAVMESMNR